jgi:cellulose synthase/poly-beta-1,6-N-acetylglucosamine synthase-like glycosyltransferase
MRYDIITLMDADTLVNADYYKEVKKSFVHPNVAVVCGRAMSVPHNWLTAYRCLGYFWTHYVYRGAQSDMGVINVAPGCASSYRSDVFLKLEWNKDTLVEDMDVTLQVHRKQLGKIVYCPKAEVYTQDPRTLRDYTKQMNRWYTGTWQIAIKYGVLHSWSKVDCEFKLLMGEGLLFSLFVSIVPLLAVFYPMRGLMIVTIDTTITVVIAVCCGVADRRTDVIIASPLFALMKFVDCCVLLISFWRTIVRRQPAENWFSVNRY